MDSVRKKVMKKLLTGFADEPIVLVGFQEIVTNRNYGELRLEGG